MLRPEQAGRPERQQADQQEEGQDRRPEGAQEVVAERAEDAEHDPAEQRPGRVADPAQERGGHRDQSAPKAVVGAGAAVVGGEDRGGEAGQGAGRQEAEQPAPSRVATE